jgi:uncharacterized phage-associated protein
MTYGIHQTRAPTVILEPNPNKVVSAIGFLIKEAEERGVEVTQYDIVKSLFIADRSHLNRFGRPITFDNYVAMKHGPVPSLAYDLLKSNRIALVKYGIDNLPWSSESAEPIGAGCRLFHSSRITNEDQILSPSDMAALRDALTVISSLTFGQVRELTHGDVAYKDAWRDGESQNAPMSLGLLFDTPDFEAAEEIGVSSRMASESERISDGDIESYFAQFESR